jgi:hypothetical protein
MAKKRTDPEPIPAARDDSAYDAILADVTALLEAARHAAARSVNSVMTATYWAAGGSSNPSSGAQTAPPTGPASSRDWPPT